MKDNKEKIKISVQKMAAFEFLQKSYAKKGIYKHYYIQSALRRLKITPLEASRHPHLFERVFYEIQQTEEKYKASAQRKIEQTPEVLTDKCPSFTVRLKKAFQILINKNVIWKSKKN